MLAPNEGPSPRKVRKHLSVDALLALVRSRFERFPDRRCDPDISLPDCLMSGVAMFMLKDRSLLAFQGRRNDENMKNLYGIEQVPSDTRMREVLDPVDPGLMRPVFNDVFRQLQRGKALEPFVFHQGCYLLALDGTGYFSSQAIHCPSCLQKVNSKTGEVTYQHQMLGAALVHPDHKEVIPLAPEPIIQQDGNNKNDCERNASKRLLEKIRREHPRLKLMVVEDGLASNAPHIRLLKQLRMHFLLGVKQGDHAFLFQQVMAAHDDDRVTEICWMEGDVECIISLVNGVPLNESNQDLLVNFLEYGEYVDGERIKHFTWVTDLRISKGNAHRLVSGGRCRWKIENETFNTLKNQGYHYEHNYGHGEQNLSVVFALLLMLAFLLDQVQQHCCPLFRAVWQKLERKVVLWEKLRSHFAHFIFESMQHLYEVMLYDLGNKIPAPKLDSS